MVEKTTIGPLGKGAAEHFQNVLGEMQGGAQTVEVSLGRTDDGYRRREIADRAMGG
jgi:hypothetical protein